jgi:hypothetical protein
VAIIVPLPMPAELHAVVTTDEPAATEVYINVYEVTEMHPSVLVVVTVYTWPTDGLVSVMAANVVCDGGIGFDEVHE